MQSEILLWFRYNNKMWDYTCSEVLKMHIIIQALQSTECPYIFLCSNISLILLSHSESVQPLCGGLIKSSSNSVHCKSRFLAEDFPLVSYHALTKSVGCTYQIQNLLSKPLVLFLRIKKIPTQPNPKIPKPNHKNPKQNKTKQNQNPTNQTSHQTNKIPPPPFLSTKHMEL